MIKRLGLYLPLGPGETMETRFPKFCSDLVLFIFHCFYLFIYKIILLHFALIFVLTKEIKKR